MPVEDRAADLRLSEMTSFQTAAERHYRERLPETRKDQQDRPRALVDKLDAGMFGLIREIRSVTEDEDLSDARKIAKIPAVPGRGQTFADSDNYFPFFWRPLAH